ncbi:MAG: DUF6263 family protein [Candidatus Omnitrophica bacterium]|nr:DUF6263 family protein [Candidatus Omnitrophota bacterium]
MKKLSLLILGLFCFYLFSQEEVLKEYDLKYIYNKGDISTYSLKIENIEKLNISGRYSENKRKVIIDFEQEVYDLDEANNGIIKMKYKEGSFNNIKINLSDKSAILKRDPKGKILESSGLQEISAEFAKIIQKSLSDYIPGFDRLPISLDFSKFDSNTFNIYLESFTPTFPNKKIKIGESWEKEIMIPIFFTKGKLIYTLGKIEENKAYIILTLDKSQIKGKGDLVFDIEKGKIIEQNFTITGENIKTKIDLGQYMPQYKQSIEISGNVIVKINLKEI